MPENPPPGQLSLQRRSYLESDHGILTASSRVDHLPSASSTRARGNSPRHQKEGANGKPEKDITCLHDGRVDRLGSMGRSGPSATAATPTAANAPVSPAADGTWPAQANGTPTHLKAGAALGYYIWHDNRGWHMEVTHPGRNHVVFSGWVSTNGTLAVQRVDDERNDLTRVGPGHHELSFAFNNYGYLTGFTSRPMARRTDLPPLR